MRKIVGFSVIIPVYNVEPYIKKCLDSLLPALEDEDEVLLVQGKSSDLSGKISEQYQRRNPRLIKQLKQTGNGLSNARNCGLRAAKEDFVLFVDSDDYVESADLSELLSKIRTDEAAADIYATDYYRYLTSTDSDVRVWQIKSNTRCGMDDYARLLPRHRCFWNVWRNIYRREFLLEHDLWFKENTYAEDINFTTKLFLADPVIQTFSQPFYHYRLDRGGSLMSEVPLERIQSTMAVLEECIENLKASKKPWSASVAASYQFEYILNMALIQETANEHHDKAIATFERYPELLSRSDDPLVAFTRICLIVFGIEKMSELLWKTKRIKRKREYRSV